MYRYSEAIHIWQLDKGKGYTSSTSVWFDKVNTRPDNIINCLQNDFGWNIIHEIDLIIIRYYQHLWSTNQSISV